MQFWQILKPQRHRQQNRNSSLQQWHRWGDLERGRLRRAGSEGIWCILLNMGHWAFPVVLSFIHIHGNEDKGFQWPPVSSPQSLNQPESAVKQGAPPPAILVASNPHGADGPVSGH
jgi:hypothetical protein